MLVICGTFLTWSRSWHTLRVLYSGAFQLPSVAGVSMQLELYSHLTSCFFASGFWTCSLFMSISGPSSSWSAEWWDAIILYFHHNKIMCKRTRSLSNASYSSCKHAHRYRRRTSKRVQAGRSDPMSCKFVTLVSTMQNSTTPLYTFFYINVVVILSTSSV